MRVGIIRYPGSNCDYDTQRYFGGFFIWHTESSFVVLNGLDLLVIPGGFAYGDRYYNKATEQYTISPGTMAIKSPVTAVIREAAKRRIPILGICLGHQSIGQAFGGKIIQAKEIMHGKTSKIIHQNDNIFSEVNNPFIATRYHSLVIEKESIPDCLEIIAWTKDKEDQIDEIMAVKHKEKKVYGVQFHPESIASEFGHKLLDNFLKI